MTLPLTFDCTRELHWQTLCAEMVERVATQTAVPRTVLQLLKQKPKSIKFYEPKFEQVWVPDKGYRPNSVCGKRVCLCNHVGALLMSNWISAVWSFVLGMRSTGGGQEVRSRPRDTNSSTKSRGKWRYSYVRHLVLKYHRIFIWCTCYRVPFGR